MSTAGISPTERSFGIWELHDGNGGFPFIAVPAAEHRVNGTRYN